MRYKIKTYEELAKEFGVDGDGVVCIKEGFPRAMEYLGGRIIYTNTFPVIYDSRGFSWTITKEMCKLLPTTKIGFKKVCKKAIKAGVLI